MIILRGLFVLVYAAVSAVEDIRYRKISSGCALLFCGIGLLLCILGRRPVPEILPAALPGLSLLLISKLSGGCVGTGDAVFLLVCALYLGKESLTAAAAAAFICCGAAALGIIAAGMICGNSVRTGKQGLPYIAFIFLPLLAAAAHLMITGDG